MNDTVDISVIIPTYNRASLLARALNSVLNQTYRSIEVIVVDDGSQDGTEESVKRINDKRIRYIKHEKNRGVSAARNTGIDKAKSNYIAFLDSDDEWLPDKLGKQIQVFKDLDSSYGVVYSDHKDLAERSGVSMTASKINRDGNIFYNLLRLLMFVSPTCCIVRRECFDMVGVFDEDININVREDTDMFLRIAKLYKFKYVDECLAIVHHDAPFSLASDIEVVISSLVALFDKYRADIISDKSALTNFNLAIGHNMCKAGKFAEGRKYLWRSIRADPLDVRAYVSYVVSLINPGNYNRLFTLYGNMKHSAGKNRPD